MKPINYGNTAWSAVQFSGLDDLYVLCNDDFDIAGAAAQVTAGNHLRLAVMLCQQETRLFEGLRF